MILAPSRQLVCPNCRKPFARPTPRRQRLRRTRNDPRDRFRPSLLNMAAGDELIDSAGRELLNESDATGAIDNGTDVSCCCGSSSGGGNCTSCDFANILVTFTGFTGSGSCSAACSDGGIINEHVQFTGSLDGFSVCVPASIAPCNWSICAFTDAVSTPLSVEFLCDQMPPGRSSSLINLNFTYEGSGLGWDAAVLIGASTLDSTCNDGFYILNSTRFGPDTCASHTISVGALCGGALSAGTITFAPGGC